MADKLLRTPFGRAAGLGSAKAGVEHWWRERAAAVALVPLTLWFVSSLIAHSDSDYAHFVAWLSMPVTAFLMVMLLIALFYHAALGLQVIVEDYLHSAAAKIPTLLLVQFGCFAFAVGGILAVVRIVLVD